MQVIAVDIGNSSTKVAVEHMAHNDRWSHESILHGDDPVEFNFAELDIGNLPAFWSVSSVNQYRQRHLVDWVKQHRPADHFHVITADEVELETDVQSRERLGRDRLIAAWQAVQLNETGPLVVIDAGTAVTVDWVDEQAVFRGGLIFPGAHSMLKSLAAQTDALPDLSDIAFQTLQNELTDSHQSDSKTALPFFGRSTNGAILLGVYQTQICTIQTAVEQLSSRFDRPLEVFVTGGGMDELRDWLPETWQFVPDLVLQGAQAIGRRLQKS